MRRALAATLLVAACRGGGEGRSERADRERELPPVTDEWVVVRADTTLYLRPDPEAPQLRPVAQQKHAGDARVHRLVARHAGGWIEVENASPGEQDGCYPALGLPDHRLRFFVRAGDLQRVTTAAIELRQADGREVAIPPGAALAGARVELPDARIALPAERLGPVSDTYRPGAISPPPPTMVEELDAASYDPSHFIGTVPATTHDLGAGVTVTLRRAMTASTGRGGVILTEGCARFTIPGGSADRDADPQLERQRAWLVPWPARPADAGPSDLHVPAGATVRLEDGTRVGATVHPIAVAARCAPVAVEDASLTLCHDVTP